MKAERDELTPRIFPSLRKICEERGIAWGEVDLRGVSRKRRAREERRYRSAWTISGNAGRT
ncbi:hypothetical protein RJ53_00295 [Methanocalculus chunghsingensis]|uniref:Uncharacterized protein n=1 Tax=Methanocalculus chunghsingensis TaxID=156457 RepID=A0A8J7W876_9EURY|nr:hypothetical protein [Methanocalculus chunghsingensis]MBR1368013.1 hypothetical protein [Methanocalculus chunghsingensis]